MSHPVPVIKLRTLPSGRVRRVLIPTAGMLDRALVATPAALRADLIARFGGDYVCPVTLRALLRDRPA